MSREDPSRKAGARVDHIPAFLHVPNRPAADRRLVQDLAQVQDLRASAAGPFTFRIRAVNHHAEPRAGEFPRFRGHDLTPRTLPISLDPGQGAASERIEVNGVPNDVEGVCAPITIPGTQSHDKSFIGSISGDS